MQELQACVLQCFIGVFCSFDGVFSVLQDSIVLQHWVEGFSKAYAIPGLKLIRRKTLSKKYMITFCPIFQRYKLIYKLKYGTESLTSILISALFVAFVKIDKSSVYNTISSMCWIVSCKIPIS